MKSKILKRAVVLILSAAIAISPFSPHILALGGDNSGTGEWSGIEGGSSTWDIDHQGYRICIVNESGSPVSNAVDILYQNNHTLPSVSDRVTFTSTRTGGTSTILCYWTNLNFPSDSVTSNNPPAALIWSGGPIGNGAAVNEWFSSNGDMVINAKRNGSYIFTFKSSSDQSLVSGGTTVAAVVQEKGYLLTVEPITWFKPCKDKLVQSGKYKPEEVTFIHDAKNDRQRLTLFDKVNSAKVKVIIGSTSKLGTGVNMQRKLIAAHHLDAPYVPKDVEQRNGRIIRQGNENSEVFVKYYSTKGTFDSYRWQLLEKKQRLITQILSGKPPARNCKDIDESVLTFAEMKAASSDNPLIAEKMQLDNEVDRLKLLQRDWLHQQERYKYSIEVGLPSIIEKKSKLVEKINTDTEILLKNPMQSDSFFLQVGETTYDTRSDAGKALISQWNKYMTSENYKEHEPSETVGKFRGVDIRFYSNAGMPLIYLVGESGIVYSRDFSLTEIGICIKLENLASDIPAQAEFALKEIANAKKDIEKAKQQFGQPFEHAEELDELIQRQADINNQLELGEEKEIIYEEGEEEGEEMEM